MLTVEDIQACAALLDSQDVPTEGRWVWLPTPAQCPWPSWLFVNEVIMELTDQTYTILTGE